MSRTITDDIKYVLQKIKCYKKKIWTKAANTGMCLLFNLKIQETPDKNEQIEKCI